MNKTDLFIRITLLLCTISISAQVQRSRLITLMGSRFQITLVDKDSISAERNIDKAVAEITRIENLISEWRPETQISQVNQNAGIKPIKVDREVFDLTKKVYTFLNLQTEPLISALLQWTKSGSLTILWMNFQVNRLLKNR